MKTAVKIRKELLVKVEMLLATEYKEMSEHFSQLGKFFPNGEDGLIDFINLPVEELKRKISDHIMQPISTFKRRFGLDNFNNFMSIRTLRKYLKTGDVSNIIINDDVIITAEQLGFSESDITTILIPIIKQGLDGSLRSQLLPMFGEELIKLLSGYVDQSFTNHGGLKPCLNQFAIYDYLVRINLSAVYIMLIMQRLHEVNVGAYNSEPYEKMISHMDYVLMCDYHREVMKLGDKIAENRDPSEMIISVKLENFPTSLKDLDKEADNGKVQNEEITRAVTLMEKRKKFSEMIFSTGKIDLNLFSELLDYLGDKVTVSDKAKSIIATISKSKDEIATNFNIPISFFENFNDDGSFSQLSSEEELEQLISFFDQFNFDHSVKDALLNSLKKSLASKKEEQEVITKKDHKLLSAWDSLKTYYHPVKGFIKKVDDMPNFKHNLRELGLDIDSVMQRYQGYLEDPIFNSYQHLLAKYFVNLSDIEIYVLAKELGRSLPLVMDEKTQKIDELVELIETAITMIDLDDTPDPTIKAEIVSYTSELKILMAPFKSLVENNLVHSEFTSKPGYSL